MRRHLRSRSRQRDGAPTLIPAGEIPCVWMQAGVLAYWLCDRDLGCDACPLDAALRHARQAAPPARRTAGAAARPQPADTLESCLDLRLDPPRAQHRYGPFHTWVEALSPSRARVGVDAFAARIVGAVRGIVPQPLGTRLRRGQPLAWLDHAGGTLTLAAPISGRVAALNPRLAAEPWLLHEDPEGAGYVAELAPLDFERDAVHLDDAKLHAVRVGGDLERWRRRVRRAAGRWERPLGPVLADGGRRVLDLTDLLGARRRCAIAAAFLGRGGTADPR